MPDTKDKNVKTASKSEIKLCSQCNGDGTIEHKELEDYHTGEYRYWNTICKQCNGSGRIKETISTSISIEPYDNPEVAKMFFEQLKTK